MPYVRKEFMNQRLVWRIVVILVTIYHHYRYPSALNAGSFKNIIVLLLEEKRNTAPRMQSSQSRTDLQVLTTSQHFSAGRMQGSIFFFFLNLGGIRCSKVTWRNRACYHFIWYDIIGYNKRHASYLDAG